MFGNSSVISQLWPHRLKEIIYTEVYVQLLAIILMMSSNLYMKLMASSTPVTLHTDCLLLDIPYTKCTVTNRYGKNCQHQRINCFI